MKFTKSFNKDLRVLVADFEEEVAERCYDICIEVDGKNSVAAEEIRRAFGLDRKDTLEPKEFSAESAVADMRKTQDELKRAVEKRNVHNYP